MNLKEEQMKPTGSIEEHEAKLIKTNQNLFSPRLGSLYEVRKTGEKKMMLQGEKEKGTMKPGLSDPTSCWKPLALITTTLMWLDII